MFGLKFCEAFAQLVRLEALRVAVVACSAEVLRDVLAQLVQRQVLPVAVAQLVQQQVLPVAFSTCSA